VVQQSSDLDPNGLGGPPEGLRAGRRDGKGSLRAMTLPEEPAVNINQVRLQDGKYPSDPRDSSRCVCKVAMTHPILILKTQNL
jgi:hypothetical protein